MFVLVVVIFLSFCCSWRVCLIVVVRYVACLFVVLYLVYICVGRCFMFGVFVFDGVFVCVVCLIGCLSVVLFVYVCLRWSSYLLF